MSLEDRMRRAGDTSKTIQIIEVEPMSRAHITPEQRAKEWERLQQAREQQYGIRRGQKGVGKVKTFDDEGNTTTLNRAMTVEALHEHFVLMKDPKGFNHCYDYGEAQLMMIS